MNQIFFKKQIERLKARFGEKAFDVEFVTLVAHEVHEMSEMGFARTVDVFIGSRTANKPPLLSEFREARLAEGKRHFDNEVRAASNFVYRKAPEEMKVPLTKALFKDFGAVDSVSDALQIARMRVRASKAGDDDPGAA